MPNQLEIPSDLFTEVDTDLRPDELTGSAGYFVRTDLRAGTVCNCDTNDASTACCAVVC